MKKLLSVTALMLSGSVLAQTGYVGGGLALVDYSEVGVSDEASLTAIYGRLGTNFNENFSGEIRVGLGLGSDTVFIDPLGFDADIKLNNLFGVYVKGGVPISDALFPYVVLGYTSGEVEASALGVSISSSESDVSFGIGADLAISDSVTASIEYMNYLDQEFAEVGGFSLSIVTKF